MSDWRAEIDAVDARLLDGYQSGFPVEPRPFRAVADRLEIDEREAVSRVVALRERGLVRRFGAVLNPPVIGSSTLAALRVPDGRFDEVAAVVNDHRQVNHNYRRDHEWNMWFVVTAGTRERRDGILDEIGARTGLEVLRLPMRTDYDIDLEFPVVNADRFARESVPASDGPVGPDGPDGPDGTDGTGDLDADFHTDTAVRADADTAVRTDAGRSASGAIDVVPTRVPETALDDLTELEAQLLLAVQDGLPLTRTPYADLVADLDASAVSGLDVDVEAAVDALAGLLERGCVKRIGCVIDHVRTGFEHNCMVVWDVPDGERDERGTAVGSLPYVTLCYHRPRRPAQGWSYNLFTMVHGREQAAVDAKIDELATEHLPFEHERLYSTQTLKQTGARYEQLLSTTPAPADD